MKKNIVITGASRGIGLELALLYAKAGHKVFCLSRNTNPLNDLKEQDSSFDLVPISFDLASEDFTVLDSIIEHNEIHTLINNAGYLVNKPFGEITSDELHSTYKVNVFGPFRLIQYLLSSLIKGKAHVLNITSMGGILGSQKFPGLSAYSSSKGALSILTECLATEFSDSGMIFNGLALGAVQTEMLNEAFPGYIAPVSPSEMAEYIFHFEQNASKVINGKVLPVANSNP